MRPGLRRWRHHAGAHRRPQAGHLRLSWRRRPGLSPGQQEVPAEWTLGENWRSDKALLEGVRRPVRQRATRTGRHRLPQRARGQAHLAPRLAHAGTAPLRVRMVHAEDGLVGRTKSGAAKAARRGRSSPPTWPSRWSRCCRRGLRSSPAGDGAETSRTELHPGHFAVLVRSNTHARSCGTRCTRRGCRRSSAAPGPCSSPRPAREWLRLLEALERPAARDRAASTALTPFVGWSAEHVATAGEDAVGGPALVAAPVGRPAARQGRRGAARDGEPPTAVPARVLDADGERFMTDLRHVAQLLHEAGATEGIGPTAMANWLGRRIREADEDATTRSGRVASSRTPARCR